MRSVSLALKDNEAALSREIRWYSEQIRPVFGADFIF